jgi:hypothetical protein
MLRNEACTHKRHHSKGAQIHNRMVGKKGRHDNNILTEQSSGQRLLAKFILPPSRRAKNAHRQSESQMGKIYFIFPVTKSLYQRANAVCRRRSSARKKEAKQRAHREIATMAGIHFLLLLAVMNCASGTNIYQHTDA